MVGKSGLLGGCGERGGCGVFVGSEMGLLGVVLGISFSLFIFDFFFFFLIFFFFISPDLCHSYEKNTSVETRGLAYPALYSLGSPIFGADN